MGNKISHIAIFFKKIQKKGGSVSQHHLLQEEVDMSLRVPPDISPMSGDFTNSREEIYSPDELSSQGDHPSNTPFCWTPALSTSSKEKIISITVIPSVPPLEHPSKMEELSTATFPVIPPPPRGARRMEGANTTSSQTIVAQGHAGREVESCPSCFHADSHSLHANKDEKLLPISNQVIPLNFPNKEGEAFPPSFYTILPSPQVTMAEPTPSFFCGNPSSGEREPFLASIQSVPPSHKSSKEEMYAPSLLSSSNVDLYATYMETVSPSQAIGTEEECFRNVPTQQVTMTGEELYTTSFRTFPPKLASSREGELHKTFFQTFLQPNATSSPEELPYPKSFVILSTQSQAPSTEKETHPTSPHTVPSQHVTSNQENPGPTLIEIVSVPLPLPKPAARQEGARDERAFKAVSSERTTGAKEELSSKSLETVSTSLANIANEEEHATPFKTIPPQHATSNEKEMYLTSCKTIPSQQITRSELVLYTNSFEVVPSQQIIIRDEELYPTSKQAISKEKELYPTSFDTVPQSQAIIAESERYPASLETVPLQQANTGEEELYPSSTETVPLQQAGNREKEHSTFFETVTTAKASSREKGLIPPSLETLPVSTPQINTGEEEPYPASFETVQSPQATNREQEPYLNSLETVPAQQPVSREKEIYLTALERASLQQANVRASYQTGPSQKVTNSEKEPYRSSLETIPNTGEEELHTATVETVPIEQAAFRENELNLTSFKTVSTTKPISREKELFPATFETVEAQEVQQITSREQELYLAPLEMVSILQANIGEDKIYPALFETVLPQQAVSREDQLYRTHFEPIPGTEGKNVDEELYPVSFEAAETSWADAGEEEPTQQAVGAEKQLQTTTFKSIPTSQISVGEEELYPAAFKTVPPPQETHPASSQTAPPSQARAMLPHPCSIITVDKELHRASSQSVTQCQTVSGEKELYTTFIETVQPQPMGVGAEEPYPTEQAVNGGKEPQIPSFKPAPTPQISIGDELYPIYTETVPISQASVEIKELYSLFFQTDPSNKPIGAAKELDIPPLPGVSKEHLSQTVSPPSQSSVRDWSPSQTALLHPEYPGKSLHNPSLTTCRSEELAPITTILTILQPPTEGGPKPSRHLRGEDEEREADERSQYSHKDEQELLKAVMDHITPYLTSLAEAAKKMSDTLAVLTEHQARIASSLQRLAGAQSPVRPVSLHASEDNPFTVDFQDTVSDCQ